MDAREIIAHQIPGASAELCFGVADAIVERLRAAGIDLVHRDENHGPTRNFALGDRVTKVKGSSWTGHVVGFYSTGLTPVGYCIESENEPESVQIYPESALRAMEVKHHG